jgi:hypothetical protein
MQDRRSEVKNEVEAGGITSPYIFPGRQGRLVEDGGAKTARRGLLAAVAYGTGCRRGGRTLTRMGEVHEQGKGAGRRQSQGSDIVFRYSTCTPRTQCKSRTAKRSKTGRRHVAVLRTWLQTFAWDATERRFQAERVDGGDPRKPPSVRAARRRYVLGTFG